MQYSTALPLELAIMHDAARATMHTPRAASISMPWQSAINVASRVARVEHYMHHDATTVPPSWLYAYSTLDSVSTMASH